MLYDEVSPFEFTIPTDQTKIWVRHVNASGGMKVVSCDLSDQTIIVQIVGGTGTRELHRTMVNFRIPL